MFNYKHVSFDTWVRVVVLFLLFANQISISFFSFKLLPFTDDEIYEGVSMALTFVATVWTAWKNNSFTDEAQISDSYLKDLKNRKDWKEMD